MEVASWCRLHWVDRVVILEKVSKCSANKTFHIHQLFGKVSNNVIAVQLHIPMEQKQCPKKFSLIDWSLPMLHWLCQAGIPELPRKKAVLFNLLIWPLYFQIDSTHFQEHCYHLVTHLQPHKTQLALDYTFRVCLVQSASHYTPQ